jgi:hypothetical protein
MDWAYRFVQQNSLRAMYVQVQMTSPNTRVLQLHPVKEWTTTLQGGGGDRRENEPNTPFLRFRNPKQDIDTIHHHRPPQPAPPKLPCTNFTNTGTYNPPHESFSPQKKQEEKVQPSDNSQYRIMKSAQRRLNGLTHSSFQCLCCISL